MNKSIDRLMSGFGRFKEKYFRGDESENSVYSKLASKGQTPKTLLIGCSDSRVDPAILMEASPGELFVVRNVANLVPPCGPAGTGHHGTSSALEFAVTGLKVENIVILGHRQCGGIRALMNGGHDASDTFISKWMGIAREAKEQVLRQYPHQDEETHCKMAEMESIKVSLKNLSSFPFVQKACAEGKLQIIGLYFDLEQGQLWQYNTEFNQFELLPI